LVFFNVAGLLILLGLDFFAMIFLVVYVGAIAVLFLFVVMMLNIKLAEINEKRLRYLPIGGLHCHVHHMLQPAQIAHAPASLFCCQRSRVLKRA